MNKSNGETRPEAGETIGLRVFVNGSGGGNPVPLVLDATSMTETQMQQVAQRYGHESAFVLPPSDGHADWRIRFFVPHHEMEMCGHATVGTLWALRQWGLWTRPVAKIETLSGMIDAEWDESLRQAWISQPAVTLDALSAQQTQRIADVLRVASGETRISAINACTSRVKTLVRLSSADRLNRLSPDFGSMREVCEELGSTGLYPYAMETTPDSDATVCARQFPKSSGYPEDAATGIAASALWGYLVAANDIFPGTPASPAVCLIRQGEAMGCPSAIEVKPRFGPGGEILGCWLSGRVAFAEL